MTDLMTDVWASDSSGNMWTGSVISRLVGLWTGLAAVLAACGGFAVSSGGDGGKDSGGDAFSMPPDGDDDAALKLLVTTKTKEPQVQMEGLGRHRADKQELAETALTIIAAVNAGVDDRVRGWGCKTCAHAEACGVSRLETRRRAPVCPPSSVGASMYIKRCRADTDRKLVDL